MSGLHKWDKQPNLDGVVLIGTVTDNNDPAKLRRVKVKVPQLWDNYKTDEIPWAIPTLLGGQGIGGATAVAGTKTDVLNVPAVGTLVYVTFQQGISQFPMYSGSICAAPTGSVLETNYPNRRGFISASGLVVYDDSSNQDLVIIHGSSVKISINAGGDILIDSTGSSSGKLTVKSKGNVSVTAPNILLNS